MLHRHRCLSPVCKRLHKERLHKGQTPIATLETPPLAPARGPPSRWAEIVQVHDDRHVIQAAPDDLPALDIRSL